jgi:hypothetical protein
VPVAEPLERTPPAEEEENLPIDPTAVDRAYRRERARRRARTRYEQDASLARVRFYAVMGVLLAATIVFLVLVWQEIRQLFGI